MPQLSMHTPISDLTITEFDGQILSLDWGWSPYQDPSDLLNRAKKQLDAYFDGELQQFDLPLFPDGTIHQKKVWQYMQTIPYGQTRTYGETAMAIGSVAQAVGNACGQNPIAILIPCHRIIASGGKLGGYSGDGGLWTKKALLTLEGNLPVELF